MSPPKSPGKKKTQQSVLFSFFKRKRRRGRPKNSNKREETRGRPRSTSTKEPPSVNVTVARPPQSYRKQQRINWSKGNDCIRLAQAVADWDGKTEATARMKMENLWVWRLSLRSMKSHPRLLQSMHARINPSAGC
jgi:hypothetical protein